MHGSLHGSALHDNIDRPTTKGRHIHMGNRAAFDSYFRELRKQGGTSTAIDIAEACGTTSASVNGVFNYHLDACEKKETKPVIVKVQNGVWSISQAAPAAKPVRTPRATATTTALRKASTVDELFERIGSAADGTIIVRGVDTQNMYRLGDL